MITIRNATENDLKDIHEINQLNSSNPSKPLNEKNFCLYLYTTYYVKFEADSCFIAIDDKTGQTVGYILGAKDYDTYLFNIENDFLNQSEELGFRKRFIYEIHAYEPFKEAYPAHFHIDVRPGNQHKGIGSKLLRAQIDHMKENDVKGLMLLVGKNKIAGNSFYEKNGFSVIAEGEDAYIRGKKL